MLLHIENVLDAQEAAAMRAALEESEWSDGRVTAGYQSGLTKKNLQLPETHPLAQECGARILDALDGNALFTAAALPQRVFPPLFNCYSGGHSFGTHVDNAIRQARESGTRIRTDLSATLFLTPPEEYDGGDLVIEDTYGAHALKLPAGHMVLYPATSLHHVTPVTRGARISSFFWIQSMIRDDGRRRVLFDIDIAIQRIAAQAPDHPSAVQLTGVYHNLIRMWAEV
ncbi:MAG: Fe2+-dependent dioxygenase [Bryobacteraceae bacterium]